MVITTMLSSKLCSDTAPYHQHTIAAESLHISPVAKTSLTLLFIPSTGYTKVTHNPILVTEIWKTDLNKVLMFFIFMHVLFLDQFSSVSGRWLHLDLNTNKRSMNFSIIQNQLYYLKPSVFLMSVKDTDRVTKVKYCSQIRG